MPVKDRPTTPAHEIAFQDVAALLAKHAGALTPIELLAVAANMVGKIIALQDPYVTTSAVAMEVVFANIEEGNAQARAGLNNPQGSA